MERVWALFSFRGRTSRAGYWATAVPINIVIWGVVALMVTVSDRIPWQVGLVVMVAFFVSLVLNVALAVRRLHDLGRRWPWVLLYLIAPAAMPFLMARLGEPPVTTLAAVVMLAGPVIGLVDMGLRRGREGPNQFGPDPLNPSPTEIFD